MLLPWGAEKWTGFGWNARVKLSLELVGYFMNVNDTFTSP